MGSLICGGVLGFGPTLTQETKRVEKSRAFAMTTRDGCVRQDLINPASMSAIGAPFRGKGSPSRSPSYLDEGTQGGLVRLPRVRGASGSEKSFVSIHAYMRLLGGAPLFDATTIM